MTRECFVALWAALAIALPAVAALPPAEAPWPPTPEVRALMSGLQATLADPQATPEARRKAREELIRLLRAPGAPQPDAAAAAKARAPRAAITIFPAIPPPTPPPEGPGPPVARVVPAPRAIPPFIDSQSGRLLVPQGRVAIDPASGRVLQEVPGGYIDGATGRFVPTR